MEREETWNELFGAAVGLVRTVDRQPADEETWGLIHEALCSLLDLAAWQQAVKTGGKSRIEKAGGANKMPGAESAEEAEAGETLTERIRRKKWEIMPDCAVCRTPCGRFSDYDGEDLWLARPEIRNIKVEILKALSRLEPQESRRDLVYRTIFALGEDWGGDWLGGILQELQAAAPGDSE